MSSRSTNSTAGAVVSVDLLAKPVKTAPKKKANKSKSAADESESEEKTKLRTSEDVYHRIRWDHSKDRTHYRIGYMDRYKGMREITFDEYKIVSPPHTTPPTTHLTRSVH